MEAKDLELLKASIGRCVVLRRMDGEIIVADIVSVSDEDQDIIFDLVSSNRPDFYRKMGEKAAYLVPFSEVSSVESCQGDLR